MKPKILTVAPRTEAQEISDRLAIIATGLQDLTDAVLTLATVQMITGGSPTIEAASETVADIFEAVSMGGND